MNLHLYLEIFGLILIVGALVLGLWRLFKGPTVPDRVVAADTLAIIVTAGLVWLASQLDNPIYLDIALVYGVLAFVAVVAIARAIEGSHR
ncbi:MAG: cation:proton antiporter [Candidatus Parabeggiatoa sp. nov. 3]|jgi:multicomponent Na+:H+ antiporter subunit F|nr:MAG: cation:proton antiporter [Gammaproteobacteria bacterium]RKZ68362.1 MAG: cation:proton antiporter [Gammaproteobacteria bacterium]RKZ86727.1 MAG: cation:proton antiporter [Gammaproteobacteria bacterium]